MDLAATSKKNPKLLYAYVNQNKAVRDSIRALVDDEGLICKDRQKISHKHFFKVFSEPGSSEDFPILSKSTNKASTISDQAFSPLSVYTALKASEISGKGNFISRIDPIERNFNFA